MSEHEHNEEHMVPVEVNPYEHKNPRTGQTESTNWTFGGWIEEEKHD